MHQDRRGLGREGEARAAAYLAARGYRIVERNVRAGGVEIDLVVTQPGLLVFVEVKTRRSRRFGAPEEAVDARKQARLVRAAMSWLQSHQVHPRRLRFDVVTVERNADAWCLRHIEGAFDANACP